MTAATILAGRLVLDDASPAADRDRGRPDRRGRARPARSTTAGRLHRAGLRRRPRPRLGRPRRDGRPAALDGMARALLRTGVTSFLPTAVTAPLDAPRSPTRVRAWRPAAPADGAEPLGFNLEGPFLADARRGAHDPRYLRRAGRRPARRVEPLLDGLAVMTIAPELPGRADLIAAGSRAASPSRSATPRRPRRGPRRLRGGARSTTHLFNAMPGVDHRAPGLAVARPRAETSSSS